ncbi:MAG: hypothetical protein ACOX81_05410 [Candidatus Heteroscillospira sp.]|jgi:acyl-CoA thioesterase FadM
MRQYTHSVDPMYLDYWCRLSPGELARILIGDTVLQMDEDGIPRLRLLEEKNGAWMVDKFRLEQFKSINHGDTLTVNVSPRREKGVRIYYTAEVMCGEELMARAELSFFAVEFFERRILRLSELTELWNEPAQLGKAMEKAAWRGDMAPAGERAVHYSDCDANQHLTSPRYLDWLCDMTGFWEGNEKLCRLMQVDYLSECCVGEKVEFYTAGADGRVYVCGRHADGKAAFDAVCRYEEIVVDTAEKR